MLVSPSRVITAVDWAFAPDWLTVSQACELSGYDRGIMLQVIEADGVDLEDDDQLLIEKLSLWEWLEVSLMLAHWDD